MAGAGELTDLARSVVERASPHLPDAPVAVALSGGADSAVCAWAALAAGATTRAITIDHGLAASGALVAAAGEVAAALGLDHVVVAVTRGGSEAAMRDARYEALGEQLQSGEMVAVGHTADDQVETVLAHLVRGAGAAGLSGMRRERGPVIRPLLEVTRAETRALATGLGLPFHDDPDNTDAALTRVRIRNEVLPLLDDVAPGARRAIIRAAGLAAADDRALDERAALVPVRTAGDETALPVGSLRAVPRAVASRAVRRALRRLLDPYAGSARDVDAVLAVAAGSDDRLPLVAGLLVSREGPEVVIHPAGEPAAPPPPVELGDAGVAWGDWSFSVAALGEDPPWLPVGRWRIAVAAGLLAGARVRCVVPGDRIDVAGGSKRVVEALREAGVPPRRRLRWPVVEADGRMIWIPGARVADGAAWSPGRGPAMMLSTEAGM